MSLIRVGNNLHQLCLQQKLLCSVTTKPSLYKQVLDNLDLRAVFIFVGHLFFARYIRFILLALAFPAIATENVIFLQNFSPGVPASLDVAFVQVTDENLLAGANVPGRIHHLKCDEKIDLNPNQ
jgi:hypothetical protein